LAFWIISGFFSWLLGFIPMFQLASRLFQFAFEIFEFFQLTHRFFGFFGLLFGFFGVFLLAFKILSNFSVGQQVVSVGFWDFLGFSVDP